MLSVIEALEKVLENSIPPKPVNVALRDTLGSFLARDLVSKDDIPPFDNSAMDGYAVKSEDSGEGKTLKIIGELPAGKAPDKPVLKGTAISIMTGAPMPEGADSVIEVESTKKQEGEVVLKRVIRKNENVRLAGEDIKKGATLAKAGSVVNPALMGLAASVGSDYLEVYAKPKVGILSTGSELVPPSEGLEPGKIRDSNSYSLSGQCMEVGIIPENLGIAPDDFHTTKELINKALDNDVLITTGGVSVGEYDFVKEALKEAGAKEVFWSVAQKPGKPFGFYTLSGKAVFALPGNPVASYVCFEMYVRPFLLQSMGSANIFRPVVRALSGENIRKKKGRANWIRVNLDAEGSVLTAYPNGPQGSGILTSMIADGLIYLVADSVGVSKGEEVEVVMLNAD